MEENESMHDFFTRVTILVNQIKMCDGVMSTEFVVAKFSRSLSLKYDHIMVAIEECKNLSI